MDPFLGEIRPIAFNYEPRGWAFCNGQLLPINQNQALFSLLGTTYGGNGTTTFALPNLRSRVPVSAGQGPGLSNYTLGQVGGVESVTLLTTQLPAHAHSLTGTIKTAPEAVETNPANQYPSVGSSSQFSAGPANTTMGGTVQGTTANTGGSQPHENRPPVLAANYVIALQGIYPSRN